ncbi:mitochondrial 37S ribosomal protein mS42 [Kluyveromyces lactis]|uniref:KLLA0E01101p n=1 Tax=Kluyveromyces lactis (strain ATCC 8585 / CBS 2359 / DSM 70799 / NBRC 1267 / NRRL Y-1140 / WM37) TaxID=284590 RepID=Q6CPZ1_KLULA|nr:mitochondrial 37S ribosomal protein RSM26 [Kluyveromyces lactis]CAG99085.1 KLLA0E01101p [Kluyveromyces lactis]|eukprot:XP_453998.1 mitochondrial 37S ribosomal protein RSM26 [Kluyveromyces lactis]
MSMFGRQLFRGIHTVPKIPGISQLLDSGIPHVMSANTFKTCWVDQQQLLCDKLTLASAGTAAESYLPFHLVLHTAKKSYQTNIFNLASALHNNHLFIENILPMEQVTHPSREFLQKLESQYSMTWDAFKDEMVRHAEEDVLGQGWLFLVENDAKELHILTVQNNGTPYYFARNQSFDLNSALSLEEMEQFVTMRDLLAANADVKDWTMPLIAISLWDHSYLNDYGIKGRSTYVRKCLDNLNWSAVNNRLFSTQ